MSNRELLERCLHLLQLSDARVYSGYDQVIVGIRAELSKPSQIEAEDFSKAYGLLLTEKERLQQAIEKQKNAINQINRSDREAAQHYLIVAERMKNESKPELIESEKQANAILTTEIDELKSKLAEAEKDAMTDRQAVALLRKKKWCDTFIVNFIARATINSSLNFATSEELRAIAHLMDLKNIHDLNEIMRISNNTKELG